MGEPSALGGLRHRAIRQESAGSQSSSSSSPAEAFKRGDVTASKAAHSTAEIVKRIEAGHESPGGEYLENILFGGLDGVVTQLAIVAAIAGGSLPLGILLLIGLCNLVAGSFSMGLGEYISRVARIEHVLAERAREQWEFDRNPEGEIEEMVVLHQNKGFSRKDAEALIKMYTANPKHHTAFIDHMMAVELRLIVPSGTEKPGTDGLVTGLSYLVFGTAPLWPAVVYAFGGESAAGWMDRSWVVIRGVLEQVLGEQALSEHAGVGTGLSSGMGAVAAWSACISLAMMFLLGAFQASSTRQHWVAGGLKMTGHALVASIAAFVLAWVIRASLLRAGIDGLGGIGGTAGGGS